MRENSVNFQISSIFSGAMEGSALLSACFTEGVSVSNSQVELIFDNLKVD